MGAANENSLFRSFADAYNDGGGSSQAQGAGAGNNQHRHQRQERVGQRRFRSQQQPENKCGQRYPADRRHKDGRDPVGQALDGGLGTLSFLHQANNLGQGGIRPNPGYPEPEEAGAVQGSTVNRLARLLVYRHTLAGKHGLIHHRPAFNYLAVHRDFLSGTHQGHIVHHHIVHRHLQLLPVPQHLGGIGLQPDEPPDGLGGLTPGPRFQKTAQQYQADNQRRRIKVNSGPDSAAGEDFGG